MTGDVLDRMVGVEWPAVSTLVTVVQLTVVVVSARVGLVQLRNGQRTAQVAATRDLVAHTLDPHFYCALQFVFHELAGRMRDDPAYAQELAMHHGWAVDAERHPELEVLARLEKVRTYVKHRLVAEDALFDYPGEMVIDVREHLIEVVAAMRAAHRNPRVWANAEELHERASAWLARSRTRRAA